MSDEKPKAVKWEVTRFILLWILLSPFVLFREEIEAVLAVLLVVAALAIAWGSWHYFPDHWYWITVPAVAIMIVIAWPLLKFADRIEARLNQKG